VMMSYLFITLLTTWRYFQREAPATNINKEYVGDPKGMQLTNDSLPIAFVLEDSEGMAFVDPGIYTLTVDYRYRETSLNSTVITPIELAIGNNVYRINYPCTGIKIIGDGDGGEYGQIVVKINTCSGGDCKSAQEIENRLFNSQLRIRYLNHLIDAVDPTTPIKAYPDSFTTLVSLQSFKSIVMKISESEVVTKDTLNEYTDPKVEKTTIVDQFVTDIGELRLSGNPPPSPFVMVSIRMGRMKTVTVRTYKTIYNYLADLSPDQTVGA